MKDKIRYTILTVSSFGCLTASLFSLSIPQVLSNHFFIPAAFPLLDQKIKGFNYLLPQVLTPFYSPYFAATLLAAIVGALCLILAGNERRKSSSPMQLSPPSSIIMGTAGVVFLALSVLIQWSISSIWASFILWITCLLAPATIMALLERKLLLTVIAHVVCDRGLYFIALLAIGVFLYKLPAVDSSLYPIWGDEGPHYGVAKEILEGTRKNFFWGLGAFDEHPALASGYIALLLRLFGDGIVSWRASSLAASVFSSIPLYAFVRMIAGPRAGIVASVCLLINYYNFQFSYLGYNNIHLIPAMTASLMLAVAARKTSSWTLTWLAGVTSGTGIYFNYLSLPLIVLVTPLLLPSLNMTEFRRGVVRWTSGLMLFLTGAMVSLVPFVLHAEIHIYKILDEHLVLRAPTTGGVGYLNSIDKFLEFLPATSGLRITTNFFLTLLAPWSFNAHSHFVSGQLFDPIVGLLCIVGITWSVLELFRGDYRTSLTLLMSYMVYTVGAGALAPYPDPPVTRLMFLIPLVSVFAALGLEQLLNHFSPRASIAVTTAFLISMVGFNLRMIRSSHTMIEASYVDFPKYFVEQRNNPFRCNVYLHPRGEQQWLSFLSSLYRFEPKLILIEESDRWPAMLKPIVEHHSSCRLIVNAQLSKLNKHLAEIENWPRSYLMCQVRWNEHGGVAQYEFLVRQVESSSRNL